MESISVFVRIRPLNNKEKSQKEENIWSTAGKKSISLNLYYQKDLIKLKKLSQSTKTNFKFDSCFDEFDSTQKIYDSSVQSVISSSLKGINGSIFMFGQSGSGKTYTMMGQMNKPFEEEKFTPSKGLRKSSSTLKVDSKYSSLVSERGSMKLTGLAEKIGMLQMGVRELFEKVQSDKEKAYYLKCSYFEIYNENVYDLLTNSTEKLKEGIIVCEDTNNKEFQMKGITEENIDSIEDVWEILERGEKNRHYAESAMKHTSSRSHTIFRFTVQTLSNNCIKIQRQENPNMNYVNNEDWKNLFKEFNSVYTEAMINFVDLAGNDKLYNYLNDDIKFILFFYFKL